MKNQEGSLASIVLGRTEFRPAFRWCLVARAVHQLYVESLRPTVHLLSHPSAVCSSYVCQFGLCCTTVGRTLFQPHGQSFQPPDQHSTQLPVFSHRFPAVSAAFGQHSSSSSIFLFVLLVGIDVGNGRF